MFSPILSFYAPDEIWGGISSSLDGLKAVSFPFQLPDGSVREIKSRPTILHTDEPPKPVSIVLSPTTYVYLFSCSTKSDYNSTVHRQLKEFRDKYEKEINEFVPVLVSRSTQGNRLFKGPSNVGAVIKGDFPNLLLLKVDEDGAVSSKRTARFVVKLLKSANKVMNKRIRMLSESIFGKIQSKMTPPASPLQQVAPVQLQAAQIMANNLEVSAQGLRKSISSCVKSFKRISAG